MRSDTRFTVKRNNYDMKVLEVTINERRNNMHEEVKFRLSAANKRYYAIKKMFLSKLLSPRTIEVIHYLCASHSTCVTNGPAQKAMKGNSLFSKGKY